MAFKDGCPSCFSLDPDTHGVVGIFRTRRCDDVWHKMWASPKPKYHATYGFPNWTREMISQNSHNLVARSAIIVVGDLEKHEEKEREKMLKMIRGE